MAAKLNAQIGFNVKSPNNYSLFKIEDSNIKSGVPPGICRHKFWIMQDFPFTLLSPNRFSKKLQYDRNNILLNNELSNNLLLMEDDSFSSNKKPIRVGKICQEFIVGELYGIGFGLIGAIAVKALSPDDDWGTLANGIAGMYLGYALGTSVGVYTIGDDEKEKGSYLATLSGCIIGALCGVRLFYAFDQKGIGSYALMLGPPIGSIIGFNLFRRARESHVKIFINNKGGALKWSQGEVCVHNYHSNQLFHISLFQASF